MIIEHESSDSKYVFTFVRKEPTTFSFTINPPYWETTWFYSAQLLFFMLLIGATLLISRRSESTLNLAFAGLLLPVQNYLRKLLRSRRQRMSQDKEEEWM